MNQKEVMGTDFTSGSMMPLVLRFMFPFLLANLLNSIYNTVDAVIIGQFVGSEGTLAVTLGGKLMTLCVMISTSVAGGGQVLLAQLYGAKRRDQFNSAIGTLFSVMFLVSLAFAVAGFCFAGAILNWMNTPEDAFPAALGYFRITCVGLPLIFGYNAVSSVLRGMGDSKNPLLFIAVAAVINLVGDLVFVLCFDLGAEGTAYATVIGQGASLLFSLFLLYRRREQFGFDFRLKSFWIDREKLGIILRIGLPMALRNSCIQITQMFMLKYVNLYSVPEATAYAVSTRIVGLTNMFSMSVRQAAGAIVGQNMGANRPDRVKSTLYCSLAIGLSTSAAISVLTLLFPETIFSFFSRDPEVIAYAWTFSIIMCVLYMLSAVLGSYDSIVTGTGNSLLGLLGGLLDGVIFRIGFSFLLAWTMGMGVAGFFLGDTLARLAPIVIDMVYYHSGAWKRYHILKNP